MIKKIKAALKSKRKTKGAAVTDIPVVAEAPVGPVVVTVKELLGQPCSGLYAPKVKDVPSLGNFSARKLGDKIIITTVQEGLSGAHYVSYNDNGMHNACYMPEDFQFEKVEMTKEILESLKQPMLQSVLYHFYSIGCDPEIFVEDKSNQLIPAFNFLPAKPGPEVSRSMMGSERPAYWDGFQAEFETEATSCLQYQTNRILRGLSKVLGAARKHSPEAKLSIKTVMDIPADLLKNAKPEHAQFGCMPSLNVYGLEAPRMDGYSVGFRPAGGHLHFGVKAAKYPLLPEHIERCVKALDAVIGVACVSLFEKLDDPRRRQLYGLPGEYRLPPHGIEYRTLSNAWLCHPVVTNLVIDLARKAFNLAYLDWFKHLDWKVSEEETIRIIRQCDVAAAREVLKSHKKQLIFMFGLVYNGEKTYCEAAFKSFLEGVESIIVDPSDVVGNWGMGNRSTVSYFTNACAIINSGKKVA